MTGIIFTAVHIGVLGFTMFVDIGALIDVCSSLLAWCLATVCGAATLSFMVGLQHIFVPPLGYFHVFLEKVDEMDAPFTWDSIFQY